MRRLNGFGFKAAGAFVLAAAACAAFLLVMRGARLWGDEAEYLQIGERVAAGAGLTTADGRFYIHKHPPLYALIVGGAMAAGGGVAAVRILQVVLYLGTLALVARAARDEWTRSVAVTALWLGAAYLPAAFYTTKLLAETVFAFGMTAALFVFTRATRETPHSRWGTAAAGFIFGVTALARAVALPVAAAVAAYTAITTPGGIWRRATAAMPLAMGTAVALLPWSVYVFHRTGHVVLTDANAPIVLYMGNNERTPYNHSWDVLNDPVANRCLMEYDRPGADVFAVASDYRKRAFRYIFTHPGETVLRSVGKTFDLLEPERLFASYALGRMLPAVPAGVGGVLAAAVILVDWAILLLTTVGLVIAPSGRWRNATLVAWAAMVAVFAITKGTPRYHVPMVVLAFGPAAYAAQIGIRRLLRGELRGIIRAIAYVLTAVVVVAAIRMVVLYVLWRK